MPHAARIISVEVEPKLFADAQRKFLGVSNVELVFGDALHVIPEIVDRLDDPPLIWLDGHFSEGVTGAGDEISAGREHPCQLGCGPPRGRRWWSTTCASSGGTPTSPASTSSSTAARACPRARIRVGLDSLVIES